MARSVATIQSYIQDALVANFATIGITINTTLWSKRNMLRQICFTVAVCQALMEQLQDLFRQEIELTVSKAAPATSVWVQDRMFKFQYSETEPQVIAIIDTVPTYPIVKTDLRLITACSVTSNTSNRVTVKVAKGGTLTALAPLELAAAQSYISIIGIAGIDYNVISLLSDKIMVNATIYFQGQYSAVISGNVIAAIEFFLLKLSYFNLNGAIKITDLEATIRNVVGVNDVILYNVRARENTAVYSAGIDLVKATATIQSQYLTIAGYISQETTTGQTFSDTLTFIAQ